MAQYFEEIKEKTCKTCCIIKTVSEFSVRKDSKDGYRNDCKFCDGDKKKIYYENNKEIINTKTKLWQSKNKINMEKNMVLFKLKNPNYQKEYNLKNKEKINERNKNRRNNDICFKIKENIRTLIKNLLSYKNVKKNQKSVEILGCNHDEFRTYLESKFEDWMTWNNYGNPKDGILEPNKTWDIDHIIPLSTANCEADILKLNHYTNLQPLCSHYNRITKRNKIK